MSFKKPDGTEMWIRHEASVEVEPMEEDKETAQQIDTALEETVRKEVGASMAAEKNKILASFEPKSDEPFPGKTPGMSAKAMPKL